MESTNRRRLLVVAYYFPPMGLSGVQRVAKFVKYLPDYGWDPVVLTVEPGGYYAYDETMADELAQADVEVHRTNSWDPTRLFGGQQTVRMPSGWKHRVFSALTELFFIPDNKIGWKRFAVQKGRELLEERSFDAIFSSAPPYTAHLIARELAQEANLPLVTDFRDDWMGNPLLNFPTPLHRYRHRCLERDVLRSSDHIVTINRPIKESLIRRHLNAEAYTKCSIIPHGYDPADLSGPALDGTEDTSAACRFLYSGVFYKERTPDYFLRGLARLLDRRSDLRSTLECVFVGLVPDDSKALAAGLGLDDVVTYTGYLSHDESVSYVESADVLWLTIGRQVGEEKISTSKLYEYMGSRKPVLGLVPEGAAKRTLNRYGASMTVAPDDEDGIASAIERLYEAWRDRSLPEADESFVRQFDRRSLTAELAKQLHDVCSME